MSLQNPKFPSKLNRTEMADEAELFCTSASKTVVFARLLVSVNDLHRGLSSSVFRVEQITQNQVPQGVPVRVRPPAPQRQKKPAPFRFRLAAKTARCWLLLPFKLRPAALGSQFDSFVFCAPLLLLFNCGPLRWARSLAVLFLRSLRRLFQPRPAALGSQFIGFVFALFAASRVYDRALKICDVLKFEP